MSDLANRPTNLQTSALLMLLAWIIVFRLLVKCNMAYILAVECRVNEALFVPKSKQKQQLLKHQTSCLP